MIGAPRFARGAAGTGGFAGAEMFGWNGTGAAGGAGVFGTATVGRLGVGGTGGAAALNPALVSTIGDMGADTQSKSQQHAAERNHQYRPVDRKLHRFALCERYHGQP